MQVCCVSCVACCVLYHIHTDHRVSWSNAELLSRFNSRTNAASSPVAAWHHP